MAHRISSGLRTAMMSAGGIGTGGTGGYKTLLDGGCMDIFTGSQPVSADYIETGTKLVRITSTCGTVYPGGDNNGTVGLRFGTASSGILAKTIPAWQGVVLVDGVAGWFRFYGTTGTSGSSATTWRFDGNCGVSGADLNLTHTSLTKDTTLTISTGTITQPAE